ncbi:hypothetical protein [Kordia sp.]
MKKRSIKNLKLNKKCISNLKGGIRPEKAPPTNFNCTTSFNCGNVEGC